MARQCRAQRDGLQARAAPMHRAAAAAPPESPAARAGCAPHCHHAATKYRRRAADLPSAETPHRALPLTVSKPRRVQLARRSCRRASTGSRNGLRRPAGARKNSGRLPVTLNDAVLSARNLSVHAAWDPATRNCAGAAGCGSRSRARGARFPAQDPGKRSTRSPTQKNVAQAHGVGPAAQAPAA